MRRDFSFHRRGALRFRKRCRGIVEDFTSSVQLIRVEKLLQLRPSGCFLTLLPSLFYYEVTIAGASVRHLTNGELFFIAADLRQRLEPGPSDGTRESGVVSD